MSKSRDRRRRADRRARRPLRAIDLSPLLPDFPPTHRLTLEEILRERGVAYHHVDYRGRGA